MEKRGGEEREGKGGEKGKGEGMDKGALLGAMHPFHPLTLLFTPSHPLPHFTLRSMVHEIVGRINGQFGTLTYVPIYHLDTSLSFTELCALYAVTDVALVTSLRDGMNLVGGRGGDVGGWKDGGEMGVYLLCAQLLPLVSIVSLPPPSPPLPPLPSLPLSPLPQVSYEYVACQSDNAGVLVLSEFAGAAQSLGAGAILVNPWNITDMAQVREEGEGGEEWAGGKRVKGRSGERHSSCEASEARRAL